MNQSTKQYSAEVRERAVRLVLEHQSEYSSRWNEPPFASLQSKSTSNSVRATGRTVVPNMMEPWAEISGS
jgi:hypothetical protein